MINEINLEQLKKIEFELLIAVHEICEKENLRYSLGGGTLLGAVRHSGFIPWDDDIDIMMPRPDYNAFISYCLSHDDVPFKIWSWETDKNYVDLSAKIYNPNTAIEDVNIVDGNKIGINIDVFPIDGLGDSYKKAVKAFKSTAFKRNLLIAAHWKTFFRSKTHAWYYEPFRFLFFVLSRFANKRKVFESVQKRYTKIDFNSVNFAAAVGGSYREKEILPQNVFTEYTQLPFEGGMFKAIAQYDKYLSSIYGDYMTLPPEEKRVSHHTFKAYYLNNEDLNG
ncbi:MAG: LicD family protein [Roseburia sp.]|nr:LicD family protein [Roseburia sp.]